MPAPLQPKPPARATSMTPDRLELIEALDKLIAAARAAGRTDDDPIVREALAARKAAEEAA